MGIEIRNFDGDGELQIVHGYGDGGFRVTSHSYQGDLLLLPRLTREWCCPDPITLRFANLEPLLGENRHHCSCLVQDRHAAAFAGAYG